MCRILKDELAEQTRCRTSSFDHIGDASIGNVSLLDAHASRQAVRSALPDDGGARCDAFDGASSDCVTLLPNFSSEANADDGAASSDEHGRGSRAGADSFPS
jgi:hypothetical protein